MLKGYSFALLKQKKHADYWIAFFPIIFTIFGLLMVFESSNVSAFSDFLDKYHYVREQSIQFVIGVVLMIVVSYIPYKKYYFASVPVMIVTIIFLLMVFIPGIGVKAYGARRWINLGIQNFQPAELAKIALIFYLSAWFSNKEKGRLLPFLLLFFIVTGLVIIEPDMGTAIILSLISMVMYFLSGASIWQFVILIPVAIGIGVSLIVSSPYRYNRLMTFWDSEKDPLGASYHVRQIMITLGSGGIFGLGLGGSKQKYQFLPEATTDSIFAIIGEEFGFLGCIFLILLFTFFLLRIIKVAKDAKDKHGFLMASGIFVLFASQIIINLCAIVSIFPMTGVPLPFISYGGSNLIISYVAIGILLNISKTSSTEN